MVKFRAETDCTDKLSYLVVETINITDDILDQISFRNRRVIFSIICDERELGSSSILHINVTIDKWNKFIKYLTHHMTCSNTNLHW